jgi:hypothetical protein
MNLLLIFILIFIILRLFVFSTIYSNTYTQQPIPKPFLSIKQALIYIKEKIQDSITIYPKNDLINNVMKKNYKNIEYKTTNLGDKCDSSKDCSDGLSCVFDGKNKYCAKEIPLFKCTSKSCSLTETFDEKCISDGKKQYCVKRPSLLYNQKINNLGQSCGKSQTILQDLCSDNLKCMSKDLTDNVQGICSRIIV